METLDVGELRETLDRLRREVDGLRASRARLVRADDDDRRRIERALHDGVHQQLIALAVSLQLARALTETDPAGAQALLDEMGRDVQQALDETARLAQTNHLPLLEARDLGAALRVAAASRRIAASVEVGTRGDIPPDALTTVYVCCAAVIDHAEEAITIVVRETDDALVFEISAGGRGPDARLVGLRDRVEALGGGLAFEPASGGRTRIAGSLPVARVARDG